MTSILLTIYLTGAVFFALAILIHESWNDLLKGWVGVLLWPMYLIAAPFVIIFSFIQLLRLKDYNDHWL